MRWGPGIGAAAAAVVVDTGGVGPGHRRDGGAGQGARRRDAAAGRLTTVGSVELPYLLLEGGLALRPKTLSSPQWYIYETCTRRGIMCWQNTPGVFENYDCKNPCFIIGLPPFWLGGRIGRGGRRRGGGWGCSYAWH